MSDSKAKIPLSGESSTQASSSDAGAEQPVQPKFTLYQGIQAATSAVEEREEQAEIDNAGIHPPAVSGNVSQEEPNGEDFDGEDLMEIDPGNEPQVYSTIEPKGNNRPDDRGNEDIRPKLFPTASSSSSHSVAQKGPEKTNDEGNAAVRSPVESDDANQNLSEQNTDEQLSDDDHQGLSSVEDDKTSKKTRTLAEMAEERILDQLKKAVTGYQATANYCCGGSIPISMTASQPDAKSPGTSEAPITSPPTILRWDIPNKEGLSQRIQFPLASSAADRKALDDLLAACAPATFGREGEDVLDETYRKAGKLDRSQFSTNFHPHDYGIVDAISQILLPDFRSHDMKGRDEHRGVLAELYKFNIYSGPAGKFHAHVDTPRGATQFGSLVVSLPYPHEGGQLRVSHNGHSTSFDWSNDSNTVQWAAFYSDCEHEVLEVKSGHRITLTYNLYVTEHIGGVIQCFPTADAALSPLYEGAKQMLEQPGFMKNGGTLGFYCAHQYAHARQSPLSRLMPYALKGIDVALFSVFKSLGLEVFACPLLGPSEFDNYESLYYWYKESFYEYDQETGLRVRKEGKKWQNMLSRAEFDKERGWRSRVGDDFYPLTLCDNGGDDESWPRTMQDIEEEWPFTEYKDVIWLNQAAGKGWEIAFVKMTWGNEASLAWYYSHAVILVEIPKRSERGIVRSSAD